MGSEELSPRLAWKSSMPYRLAKSASERFARLCSYSQGVFSTSLLGTV